MLVGKRNKQVSLRWLLACGLLLLAAALTAACSNANNNGNNAGGEASASPVATTEAVKPAAASYEVDEQPGTVYYEVFVRSFYDTNGDGIGDLNGVTAKLDYLKELGVGGIWLMPINASPSYHGYDVTDYYAVNPDYGTLDDLKKLLEEAHKRDIKVIMDLVVNHTSKEHPWFKEALANPSSPYRSWYHFAGKDEQVAKDGAVGSNPWHKAGDTQYLGIFWEGMPDLNFDEPAVRSEMIKIGQFWLEQGLDGFRLDAAKHIYGDFTSTVNTDEVKAANVKWWQEFRSGLMEKKQDVFLIGEVWDSLAVIAPYFNKALDSAFHFDLADKLIGAANAERDPDIAFTLKRAYGLYSETSGGAFTDAPFLSNHDQNRVMTAVNGNVDHAKMAASLLLTLPGNPFLYYGEELGMKGSKPDEYIREPMPWYAAAAGGEGQTTWEVPKNNTAPASVSVEVQQKDEQSLLAHYKQLLQWRKEEPALRDGTIDEYELAGSPPEVSAFIRVTKTERVLVVHNLSGQAQSVELQATEPYGTFGSISHTSNQAAQLDNGKLTLPPYSSVILK